MNQKDLTKGSISKLIKFVAVPASVGFFFNTMYNVVDTFYAGLISTEALAALGLTFPVFFLIIAMGSGIGTGTTALISNALGAKNTKKAKHYAAQAISFSVLLSVLLAIIGIYLSKPLFGILGASGSYLEIAYSYVSIIFGGTILFVLAFAFNSLLNAEGDTKSFRNFLIAGFLANLILDPALMYGWLFLPALGLKGVAWATLIVEFGGVLYLGYKVIKSGIFKLKIRPMIPTKAYIDISKQGFPAALNMMTVALGFFITTYFLSDFGKEAVAAYGAAIRIEQIILLPTIGLNIATLAIIGQNNGANKIKRVLQTRITALKYGFIIMTVGTVVLLFFARQMMGIFTNDPVVEDIGTTYLRFASFLTWAYSIIYINISALQGIKKPQYALYIGIYRQIFAPIVLFTLLTAFFGIMGIWVGIFINVWTGAIMTIWFARKAMPQY